MDQIYIPLWLNIKWAWRRINSFRNRIYIPLWLNIKRYIESTSQLYLYKIYIPLWLNIKIKKLNTEELLLINLHSTLIKYKVKIYLKIIFYLRFTFHSD